MSGNQISITDSGFAVQGICNANPTVWSGLPAFVDGKADLDANLAALALAGAQQSQITKGITLAKEQMRSGLVPDVLSMAAMLRLVGTNMNDAALLQQGKVTKSTLVRGKADTFVGICKRVLEAASNVSHLVRDPYGITGAFLTAFADKLDLYIAAMPATRVAEVKKVGATKEVVRLVRELRGILEKQLDPAAYLLSQDNIEFYEQYLAARKLVGPSHRTRMLSVKVVDKATGKPLQKVKAMVFPVHVYRTTTAMGQFYINTLVEGTYTITFSRPGYISQEVPVELVTGVRLALDVEMMAG